MCFWEPTINAKHEERKETGEILYIIYRLNCTISKDVLLTSENKSTLSEISILFPLKYIGKKKQ